MLNNMLDGFAKRVDKELKENILKFWMDHMVDEEHGGFYGRLNNDLHAVKDSPKGLVLNTRILWTFSAAYRLFGNDGYLAMAKRAYDYIMDHFWDEQYKGGYWMLDYMGNPLYTKKQVYGEAFTIYALAEYYRVSNDKNSLDKAIELFHALEEYAYDKAYKGYFEGYTREWGYSDDLQISLVEHPDSKKTMNTHLHLLEAYTNLLRVWDNDYLREKLTELAYVMLEHVIDRSTWHFKLFMDEQWNSLTDDISFGHDIEGSWLLMEAAEVLAKDKQLTKDARTAAINMAEATLRQGLDQDGGMYYEAEPGRITNTGKFWWPQSESVVGFLNAYQLTGDRKFLDASLNSWAFIENYLVDKVNGEWFEYLKEGGVLPSPGEAKADMWKCPYHNSRACFEVLERLKAFEVDGV